MANKKPFCWGYGVDDNERLCPDCEHRKGCQAKFYRSGAPLFTLWENGFSWGLKLRGEVISYDLCDDIKWVDKKLPRALKIVKKLNEIKSIR